METIQFAMRRSSFAQERTILGVAIKNLYQGEAIALIDKASAQGEAVNVAFANASSLNIAYRNDRFRSALGRFVVLNDGLGADIASRIKYGEPFRENLNGTDFVPDFLDRTNQRLRLFLVGTTDETVIRAAQKLHATYPQHTIVGWRNGFFEDERDIRQTCAEIRAAEADCVLVGMGNPQQELWIDEYADQTGARLFFAVGALLDFQAGRVPRAPAWVRRMRCEWIYRLSQEPVRLARRYLVGNFVFLSRVLLSRVLADART